MLRIGKFLISTGVNGPGNRFVIWFQGCRFRCKGCFNPEFWEETDGTLMSIDEVMDHISTASGIEGVTFTGGEPLIQAKNLLPLARAVQLRGLSIVCYTGYQIEDILSDEVPFAKPLLEYIDILIDGLYIDEQKAPLLWRGSRNQRVHFLTDRYAHLKSLAAIEGTREAEIQVGQEGITMTGIFDMDMWVKLRRELEKR